MTELAVLWFWFAINAADVALYVIARRRGAAANMIPLSGFWMIWKTRKRA